MQVKIEFLRACVLSLRSFLTLHDLMNCSLPGSSVHAIFQARILEWVAMLSSPDSSQQSFQSSSVQFSHSVMSNSATPWTIQCQASLSINNSWSLLKLMSIESVMLSNHLISDVPFSSCLRSFPASGSFQMSQFFTSGGQSFGASGSASVLPMNNQD